MRKYSAKQAAGAQKIETLGGDYADGLQLTGKDVIAFNCDF